MRYALLTRLAEMRPTMTGEGAYGDLLVTWQAAAKLPVSAAVLRRRADGTWGVLIHNPGRFRCRPVFGDRRQRPRP
jgi:hypothetical protein